MMPLKAYTKGQSAMLDAVSTCIGEREKSRDRYLRGELLFYAQGPYQGMQFRTAFGTDSSLQLRMTIKIAQNDSEDRAE